MRGALAVLLSFIILFSCMPVFAGVDGDKDVIVAGGYWKETHERVILLCFHSATSTERASGSWESMCILTEAKALEKEKVQMASNMYKVSVWNDHELVAEATFFVDDQLNAVKPDSPNGTKFTMTITINLDSKTVIKTNSFGIKKTVLHLTDNN